jgi:hypothetical protein
MGDTKLWAHEEEHWWGPIECDGLFLLFDTSAHVNDGVPTVTPDEAVEHISGCAQCQELDMRVTIDADGLATVENVA